jgi:hypothetical protein
MFGGRSRHGAIVSSLPRRSAQVRLAAGDAQALHRHSDGVHRAVHLVGADCADATDAKGLDFGQLAG